LSAEEKEIGKLVKDAKFYVETEDLKKAGEKLHEAIRIAERTANKGKLDQIMEFIQGFTYSTKTQTVELSPMKIEGFVLDIGGGGQGVIGRLYNKQAIAIDASEKELKDTENEALKIVMDATDLKFLPASFELCTSFFSLMYVPKSTHLKVFEEAHRVLKDNGSFLLWDVRIPQKFGDYKAFMVHLKVRLPDEEMEAGYGVKWQQQNMEYFKKLAEKAKFKAKSELSKGEIFQLEMVKMQ